ncbi:MAG TPA: PAS domain S-box protein [Thermoanaerobaculia bacterium]|nr:PAS domain S-box protein [Thermoanaerobaculia bacterium]
MTEPRGPLQSSTDEFALLVDAVQDYAIFLLSPTGEIRSWNRGAARITGYSAEEIVGRRFSTFYTDEDLRNRKPDYELATASSEGRVEDEGWRVRRDGNRFWANTVITALRNAEGELLGFAKVTRDLSERRSAEERLRQNEGFFRLLVESVRDYAIFMLDAEGNVAS